MRVVHAFRVLVPLVIAALVVAVVATALSARPQLQSSQRAVRNTWRPLQQELTARYEQLNRAQKALQASGIGGPVRTLDASVGTAILRWNGATARGNLADEVAAANDLEALGRRLVATARAAPPVLADAAVNGALTTFAGDKSLRAADAQTFNNAVTSYDKQRRGPLRGIVARALGYDDVSAFDLGFLAAPSP